MTLDQNNNNPSEEINNSQEIPENDFLDMDLPPRIPLNNISRPYVRDDLFKDLLVSYQNAEWERSLKILESLIKLYPEEPTLIDFQEDIQMRSMLYQKGSKSQKAATRLKIGQLSVWIVAAVVMIAGLFFVGRWAIDRFITQQETQIVAAQATSEALSLVTKYNNARDYLTADRPEEALRLLLEIEELSPGYQDVLALIWVAEDRIALEELYQEGIELFEAGSYQQAVDVLSNVQELDPDYKDVDQVLSEIDTQQTIESLIEEINRSYDAQEWEQVENAYGQILELDTTFSQSELDEKLFIAYMNLIILIADRPDATMDDITAAEEYYRAALALFPQSREFADEREELERVATNLIVNKLYIYAVSLLDTEHYSVQALEEAIRILNRANTIGGSSPAVVSEMNLAESFLAAYNALSQRNYDSAITGFENILRIEPDYGEGILDYLLYEAHIARGDIFTAYGEFANAREDYESAETYAWGANGSTLQLFQVEMKIGNILRRLGAYDESAQYFHYAASLINMGQYIDPEQSDVIEAFEQAELAYIQGQFWEASRLYDYVHQQAQYIFPTSTVFVSRSGSLLHISFSYGSTLDYIRDINSLGDSIESRVDQEILVPYLDE